MPLRLAGVFAVQGVNRRADKLLHLLARDDRVVDDGQDAVHDVRSARRRRPAQSVKPESE